MQPFKALGASLKPLLLEPRTTLMMRRPVQPADVIFVMAGRMQRKEYGLELFRSGWAARLILSIGRFEVSKMSSIDLEGFAELKALRDRTPPEERHFFMKVDSSGVSVEKVSLPKWNTYGEVLALRRFLETDDAQRVMVVSTHSHLPPVAFTFTKVFRQSPIEFRFVPLPHKFRSKTIWWTGGTGFSLDFKELIKFAGYRVILSMPDSVAHRLMRLKIDLENQTKGEL